MPRKWTNSEGINIDTERRDNRNLEALKKQVILNYGKPKQYTKNDRQYPMKKQNRNHNKTK